MPIVYIDKDELYPVYDIREDSGVYLCYEVELTEKQIKFIKEANKNFEMAQDMIESAIFGKTQIRDFKYKRKD